MPKVRACQTAPPGQRHVAIQVKTEELFPLMVQQTCPSPIGSSDDNELAYILPEDRIKPGVGVKSAKFRQQLAQEFIEVWRELGIEIRGVDWTCH
ncbi:hypothetical protein TKK_0011564 [Trichogramma kaykai]